MNQRNNLHSSSAHLSRLLVFFISVLILISLLPLLLKIYFLPPTQIKQTKAMPTYEKTSTNSFNNLQITDLILTNKDNGGTFYVIKGSLVGLKLDLTSQDLNGNFVVSSSNDVLLQTEKPFLDKVHNKLIVAYRAIKSGKVSLSYTISVPCYTLGCSSQTSSNFHVFVIVN